ncbi:hypothetical protein A2Y83_01030 [Candidatus Falkowbacteria bacterium RBG_13_39_14]|uniref:DNA repair protein RadA n=1 Tax=Candidatus Falkowbacteria bacterium RBG_13_39_14 TaxID=1797985 RepID=A0A1F5S7A6_9BACT|nr:MAG: hypothetical protein A2Y83_01030 [Candidatus Falkowbacteria bacterium RBG_13_39_14]
MPKQDTIYTCSKCGAQFLKWQGRCSECGAWGSVSEDRAAAEAGNSRKNSVFPDNAEIIDLSAIKGKDEDRVKVGIEEVDRVLGGGIVPGSLILLGGEPGIGKSTLVLQIAEKLGERALDGGDGKVDVQCGDAGETEKQKLETRLNDIHVGQVRNLKLREKGENSIEGEEGREGVEITNSKLQITNKLQIQNSKFQKMSAESELKDKLDNNRKGVNILYASGEESAEQIKMRIDRLGISPQDIHFLSETNVELICGAIQKHRPRLAIIDSIQMLYSDDVESECGSVSQIRACAAKLMGVAKTNKANGERFVEIEKGSTMEKSPRPAEAGRPPLRKGVNQPAIIIIGHITKDGTVAGPKTLEHLVDTVLYMEGERYHTYRILRTVKNRFGSTNEIGVFEMASNGLREIKNPSALFMEEHKEKLPGTIVTSVMEGTRPFLIEIQALTATTNFGYPQRKVSGFDLNRLQLLLAVLQKRLGLNFSNKDVYLNIVGGFKIQEPSADLAVCLALISALKNEPLEAGAAAFGEVGLGGEIRSVSQTDKRIHEAKKLGFKNIICPKGKKSVDECIEFSTLAEAVGKMFGEISQVNRFEQTS